MRRKTSAVGRISTMTLALVILIGWSAAPAFSEQNTRIQEGVYGTAINRADVSERLENHVMTEMVRAGDNNDANTDLREQHINETFAGDWELWLKDGTFKVYKNRILMVGGKYTVKGDSLVIHDEGDSECPDPGHYRWAYDGKRLTLVTIEDDCLVGNFVLTAHPWEFRGAHK